MPVVASKNSAPLEIFSGWKEIAHYLRKGVRTVQRYERELGLPIQRPNGKSSGSVIATKVELDGWVNATPTQVGSLPKRWPTERTNKLGAQFLLIDSEIALTFSGIAFQTSGPEKRRHRTRTARKAYDTIMRLRKSIHFNEAERDRNEAERDRLDANLQRLKNELHRLGESF